MKMLEKKDGWADTNEAQRLREQDQLLESMKLEVLHPSSELGCYAAPCFALRVN